MFFNELPDVRFEVATAAHRPALLNFMLDTFRVQEPITSSVGTSREDALPFYNDLADSGLKQAVSYLALDAATDELLGCRLNDVCEAFAAEPAPHYSNERANDIARFIEALEARTPAALVGRKLMKFVVVCVQPRVMRRGIGSRLVELSVAAAARAHCAAILTTATALRSQRLFDKCGFVTAAAIAYADHLRPDGQPVFSYLHDGATHGKLMVKYL